MAKVVIFSDLHAHAFKPYATILPSGMNSRLADAVSCIDQIHDYAVKNDVDAVLFGGDMFHVRRHIAVQAFNAVYESMSQFSVSGIPVLMIHGNHDQADKEGGQHSIHAFRTFLEVVDKPGWCVLQGKDNQNEYAVLAVPYIENLEVLRDVVQTAPPTKTNQPTIFLGHLGVQGARVGADFVYRNPHDPAVGDLDCSRFDLGFLGHFHEHQQLPGVGNFWYIGAPLQHNWGDRDQWRGFLVLDTETRLAQRVELKSPQFMLVDGHRFWKSIGNDNTQQYQGNYVRVVDDQSHSSSEREQVQSEIGARSLEFVPQVSKTNGVQPARLDISKGPSYQELVDSYVRSGLTETAGLDEDYLISLGQQIMEEVESEEQT